MKYPNIDPIAITIGPFSIHWYGISYLFGILSGYLIAIKANKKIQFKGDLSDLGTSILIGLLIGGRLGYVIIYDFIHYLNHPVDIIAIWKGGMSFHGGAIGALIGCIVFCKNHKLSIIKGMDILALAVTPGLFFGRIANFINGELYGRATQAPWGIIFPNGGDISRHPSQLYEAFFEGAILFALITLCLKYKYETGRLFTIFIFGYSIFRFLIEFTRAPDNQLGLLLFNLSMGQYLSIIMIFVGFIWIYVKNQKLLH